MEVMRRHPNFEEKCPPGSVIKRMQSPYGDWRLEVWARGTYLWDISWVAALRGKHGSDNRRVTQAARRAVGPQIVAFKRPAFGTHVDHTGTGFADLFRRFLNGREPELTVDEHQVDTRFWKMNGGSTTGSTQTCKS